MFAALGPGFRSMQLATRSLQQSTKQRHDSSGSRRALPRLDTPISFNLFLSIAMELLILALGLVCLYFLASLLRTRVSILHSTHPILVPTGNNQLLPISSLINSDACPALNNYLPTPWLLSPHLQTVYASFFGYREEDKVRYERELVKLPDGGTVSQDWSPAVPRTLAEAGKPIVFITHGLTGGSNESYVESLVRYVVQEMGMVAVCQNFRGCAGTELTRPICYSGGWTGDLAVGVEHVRGKILGIRQANGDSNPYVVVAGVGFSLGANIMLKYVGEMGDRCPLACHISIANPYDLLAGSRHMDGSWFLRNTYSRAMAGNLIAMLGKHVHHFHRAQYPFLDLNKVASSQTIAEFDDRFTAPLFGFASANEYYRCASSSNLIHSVSIPTVLLHALDDPIAPFHCLPLPEVRKNPYLTLIATQHGGHLGWFRGFWTPHRWSTDAVAQVLGRIVPMPRTDGELGRTAGETVVPVRAQEAWDRTRLGREKMGIPATYDEEQLKELRKRTAGWDERSVEVVMERSRSPHGIEPTIPVATSPCGISGSKPGPVPQLSDRFKEDLEVAVKTAKASASVVRPKTAEKDRPAEKAVTVSPSLFPFETKRKGRPATLTEMLRTGMTVGSLVVVLYQINRLARLAQKVS